MNIRELPDVVAFYEAGRKFCGILEQEPTDVDVWGRSILSALAILYARGHILPEPGLPDNAPDLPSEFDVTQQDYDTVARRMARSFAQRNSYWCYFDPIDPDNLGDKPTCGMLSDDLSDIYRDILPGIRAWQSQRDELLHTIVFDWKIPNFGSHWGPHAISAMRALHALVFDWGFSEPNSSAR
jgi:hypothetical protein